MVRHVDAIFTRGALRPLEPLPLPEGTRVHLNIEVHVTTGTVDSARQLAALESFTAGMTSGPPATSRPATSTTAGRASMKSDRVGFSPPFLRRALTGLVD